MRLSTEQLHTLFTLGSALKTFRKSWVAYVVPSFLGVLFFWFAALIINARPFGGDAIYAFLPAGAFIIIGVRFFVHILALRRFNVTVTSDAVIVSFGLLPWNRAQRCWTGDQLYEVLFNQHGFVRWALRFGDVFLDDKKGSTDRFAISTIAKPRQAYEAIAALKN